MVHHGLGFRRDDQKIQVADRVLAAAIAAGHFELVHEGALAHPLADGIGKFVGIGPVHAHVDRLGQRNTGQNRLLGLGGKALELAHLLRLARRPQLVQRADVQFLEQLCRLLRSHARNAQQRQHRLRHLGLQFLEHRQLASGAERGNLVGQVLAQPRDLGQLSLGGVEDVLHLFRIVAHGARTIAIGSHAKGIGVLKLEQVGDEIENFGNADVVHVHHYTPFEFAAKSRHRVRALSWQRISVKRTPAAQHAAQRKTRRFVEWRTGGFAMVRDAGPIDGCCYLPAGRQPPSLAGRGAGAADLAGVTSEACRTVRFGRTGIAVTRSSPSGSSPRGSAGSLLLDPS